MSFQRYGNSYNVKYQNPEPPCHPEPPCRPEPPCHPNRPGPIPPFPSNYDHTLIYNDTNNPRIYLRANPFNITGYAGLGLSVALSPTGIQTYPVSGSTFTIFPSSDGITNHGPSLVLGYYETGYAPPPGSVSIGDEARSFGPRNFILGGNTRVIGSQNYSLGYGNGITGIGSYAFGSSNHIVSRNSYTFGENLTIPPMQQNTYLFGKDATSITGPIGYNFDDEPNIQIANSNGVGVSMGINNSANGFIYLNGSNAKIETQNLLARGNADVGGNLTVTGNASFADNSISIIDSHILFNKEGGKFIQMQNTGDLTFRTKPGYNYLFTTFDSGDSPQQRALVEFDNVDRVVRPFNFYGGVDLGISGDRWGTLWCITGEFSGLVNINGANISDKFRVNNNGGSYIFKIDTNNNGLVRIGGPDSIEKLRVDNSNGDSIFKVDTYDEVIYTKDLHVSSNIDLTSVNGTADKMITSIDPGNMKFRIRPEYLFNFSTVSGATEVKLMQILTYGGNVELQPLGIINNIGSSAEPWSNIYSNNFHTITSDRNLKSDIKDSDLGLEFIESLRPVSYRFIRENSDRIHYGLISQEVEENLTRFNKSSMEFGGLCKDQKKTKDGNLIPNEYQYSLRYGELISPMIKSIQDLSRLNNNLMEELTNLRTEYDEFKTNILARISALENP